MEYRTIYRSDRLMRLLCLSFVLSLNTVAFAEEGIPVADWPSPLSPFCVRFLNICYGTCFKTNRSLTDSQGKPYTANVISVYCQRQCWNHPARAKLCRMSEKDLLELADKYEREERQKLAEEQHQQQKETAEEHQHRAKAEQQRRLEQQRIAQQQKELLEQRRELAKLRQSLQEQANQLKHRAIEQSEQTKKRFAEEQRQLTLQRKLLLEEQRRIAAQKRIAEERQKQEQLRRQQEEQRLAELERLRKARLQELENLKQQREVEEQRAQQFKQQIAKQEEDLRTKQARFKQLQAEAENKQQQELAEQLRKERALLQAKTAQLQKLRKQLASQSRQSQRRRLARLTRIKRLRTRAQKKQKRITSKEATLGKKELRGQNLFRQGNLADAIKWFQQHKHNEMLERAKEFESVFRNGSNAHQQRNPDAAIPDLERSITLDFEISEGSSQYTPLLRQMLANMYISKGILAMSQSYHSSAFIYFSVAKRHIPNHHVAKQYLDQLHQIAKENFDQATRYQTSNPALARKYFQMVVKLVPRSDPMFKKAREVLDQ